MGIVLVLGLIWVAVSYAISDEAPKPDVVLRKKKGQGPGGFYLSFEFVNGSDLPLICPDIWWVEHADGAIVGAENIGQRSMMIQPGSTSTVTIPNPSKGMAWRLSGVYVKQSLLVETKLRLSRTPVRDYVPTDTLSTRTTDLKSDWVNQ